MCEQASAPSTGGFGDSFSARLRVSRRMERPTMTRRTNHPDALARVRRARAPDGARGGHPRREVAAASSNDSIASSGSTSSWRPCLARHRALEASAPADSASARHDLGAGWPEQLETVSAGYQAAAGDRQRASRHAAPAQIGRVVPPASTEHVGDVENHDLAVGPTARLSVLRAAAAAVSEWRSQSSRRLVSELPSRWS